MLLVAGIPLAAAQILPSGRLEVPSAGLAMEDGAATGWVNPANLAYDPDRRWGVYAFRELDRPATHLAGTAGLHGFALGVTASTHEEVTSGSVDVSAGFELPARLALGAAARLGVRPDADDGSADLAMSWRPHRRFGMSVIARGAFRTPNPALPLEALVGVAVRPTEGVTLGAEGGALRSRAVNELDRPDLHATCRATARAKLTRGVWLRAHGGVGRQAFDAGAALEIHAGGAGVGLAGRTSSAGSTVGGWIGSGDPGESAFQPRGTVPVADLGRPPAYEPRRGLLAGDPDLSWLDVLRGLEAAEQDPRTAGVVLAVGRGLGTARQAELRARIIALEAAGKVVTVYFPGSVDTGGYWAATPASNLVMHPSGSLDLVGVSMELQSVRGLLDLVGVEAQVARQGVYKSAGEFLTHTDPSPEQLEQVGALLDDVHDELVAGIAAGRELDASAVRELMDGAPWSPEQAVEHGLIDVLAHPDEIERVVGAAIGRKANLRALAAPADDQSPWRTNDRVAVIYLDGAIVSGPSGQGGGLSGGRRAGAATVIEQLERARNDGRVKAVVLRVESPGGSVIASEDILRAVHRLQREHTPVVVSMGSVAGSGGYYVAASADAIWAHPNTLTGSIGVIATKISPAPLLDRLGVGITQLERGQNASIESQFTAWDDRERERVQSLVDGMYVRFKAHVSDGRALSEEAVEEVARGRIWSGRAAATHGLVDQLGGLQEAIADAAARADLDPQHVRVVSWPPTAGLDDLLAPAALPIPFLGQVRSTLEPLWLFAEHPEERLWLIDPWVHGLR